MDLIASAGIDQLHPQVSAILQYSFPNSYIICNGGLLVTINRAYNSIAENFSIKKRLNSEKQLTVEQSFEELDNLIEHVNREQTLILLNIENLGNEEFIDFSERLTCSGIHLVSICKRQNLLHNYMRLGNFDAVIPIKSPKKNQLFAIYRAKAVELGLLLRDDDINYIIDLQYRANIYHRKFGFDFLNHLKKDQ